MMEIELPEDVSTFRLMSAPIARLVAALPERRKFFSALIVWSGARIGTVRVRHDARHAGSTHYNFTKLLNHTFDLIVGFSSKPLRYIGTLGFVFALLGLGLGVWVIARKLAVGLRHHGVAVALRGGGHPRRRAARRHERHRRVHRAHLRPGPGAAALQRRPSASTSTRLQAGDELHRASLVPNVRVRAPVPGVEEPREGQDEELAKEPAQ